MNVRVTILSLAMTLAASSGLLHAQLRVPRLPQQDHDYVGYAITDLPAHYQTAGVQATNNTPVDNPITNAGATLGRVLFYDRQLSHNNSIACASCHQQSTGFGDTAEKSQGVNGETGRHSMALSNVGYYERGNAFWDERANSLEEQALMPIQDPIEMNLDLGTLVTRLENSPYYGQLFEDAFGTSEVTTDRIGKAIAQFERSMVSYQSPYDQTFEGGTQANLSLLTPSERQGFQIFHGVGRCNTCHQTNAMVGDRPHNVGLDPMDTDDGAGNGQFKSPSLRNAEVRGRYMHDGRFASLEEVIEFYSTGVNVDNPNVAPGLMNLNLTQQQKDNLLAFLVMLTDDTFLSDEKFSDPFQYACDFDGDGDCLTNDLDAMLGQGPIASGVVLDNTNAIYDMNFDGVLNQDDLTAWLNDAGLVNGFSGSFLLGDANLDGTVDEVDLNRWIANRFTPTTSWSDGDFNGDGVADLADLHIWNEFRFSSVSPASTVPEPNAAWLICLSAALVGIRRRRLEPTAG